MYKGFSKDMTCRGFKYEEGKEYKESEAVLCVKGFHACENPIDCLSYYPPSNSIYREVELNKISEETEDDSKRVGKEIKIGAKIDVANMVKIAFDYAKSNCTNNKLGGYGSALNGGYGSALNGGNGSALNGGYGSALNGGYGSALNGGNRSALNGGNGSALNGGYGSALNGGYGSALNGGNYSALNGGYGSALNGGNRSVVYGGEGAKVKAGKHSVLAIQFWKHDEFVKIAFAEVDGKKIKPDTWYKLDENGEFTEEK
jgi:hypothetical protein